MLIIVDILPLLIFTFPFTLLITITVVVVTAQPTCAIDHHFILPLVWDGQLFSSFSFSSSFRQLQQIPKAPPHPFKLENLGYALIL